MDTSRPATNQGLANKIAIVSAIAAIVLVVNPFFPTEWEPILFIGAIALGTLSGYLRWRSVATSQPHTRYKSLSGSFFFLAALFVCADLRLFDEGGVITIGLFLLLSLGGYFAWRIRL